MKLFTHHIHTGLAVAAGVFMLGSLAASPTVLAIIDDGTYSGANCNSATGSSDIRFSNGVMLNNNSIATRTVVCGGRANRFVSSASGYLNMVKADATPANCTFNYRRISNNVGFTDTRTFSGSGVVAITFPAIGNFDYAAMYFVCDLPKKTGSGTGVIGYGFVQ